ncbi:Trp biosynthesis-associated membrane protein [Dactylosporangium roseum]|uniref:Trp biosynthesis-associated membrane protein n=1 Tax=Dactylosporangium roseum TaxID=47989 RepID=A0ABY5Z069_9ACTN|nr:Trp biosynthesis-associated membrane protein [Dactylosporangium roseum]UWZ35192.1 Trp biosynthesis-associated membrane protein [Dactylosporangium roseum]
MKLEGRRGLTVTALACAAGAAVVLFAATRGWQEVLTQRVAPLPPVTSHRSGTELAPWLPALGAVSLAGAGALLATRGVARAVVGAVLALSGAGIAVAALVTLGQDVIVVWPLLCTVAAVVVAVAGVATIRFGRTWPEMGARYERPKTTVEQRAPKRPASQAELWDALDRGEDPTTRDGGA